MKRYVLLTVIFILLSFHVDAQLNSATAIHQKGAKKEWEFSFFIHRSFSGYVEDIRTSTVTRESSGTENSVGNYSTLNKKTPISFQLKYNISQRSGISFGTGRLNAFTIIPPDQSPRVKSILSATSLNYVYSFGHNKLELNSGISVMVYQMKPRNKENLTSLQPKTKSLGINFGYSYRLIESKSFFLALHSECTLTGSSSVGPFSVTEPSHHLSFWFIEWFESTTPARTTSFPATKVNLTTFNIGISMGFRFGKEVSSVHG